jgi:microcystin-dependent protein
MAEPFLGELKFISWNFPPKGWTFCNGQLLPINQNQALFAILGTTYGGDGRQTFGLPNLQGRMPVHVGDGIVLGERSGETAHTINISELPAHNHVPVANSSPADAVTADPNGTTILGASNGGTGSPVQPFGANIYGSSPNTSMAPGWISSVGGSQPHENMSPYLVVNVIIALTGIFPSQN